MRAGMRYCLCGLTCSQKNAWMTCDIFHDWFHATFVPTVSKELGPFCYWIIALPTPVLRILSAMMEKLLLSICHQAMDPGVLESLKRRYMKKLLRNLVISDENGIGVIAFLKSINMKVVINLITESWKEICASTLKNPGGKSS